MNAYRANGGYSGMEYDRWVEKRSGDAPDKSGMTKLEHQFWVTKQSVYRKLGKKEDECIVASDAELDSKLDLFRSIQESCQDLQRIIDKYQERLLNLANEENAMGRFLREEGKNDKTNAGKMMSSVGKSMSYSGLQRLTLREPLLRLHQEVDSFRHQAIDDTLGNVRSMEKARVEYRATLNWMKDVSTELDPDTYGQLGKFRKVQGQVRANKAKFDQQKLDCLQKIDLLSAARCNMFSHALILYHNSLVQFAEKVTKSFTASTNNIKGYQHYEFCVVKELAASQALEPEQAEQSTEQEIDTDKLLFFESDYHDLPDLPSTTAPTTAPATAPLTDVSGLDAPLLDLSLVDLDPGNNLQGPGRHGDDLPGPSIPGTDMDLLDLDDEMLLLSEIFSDKRDCYPAAEPASDPGSGFLPSHLLDLALLEPAVQEPAGKAGAVGKAPPTKKSWFDLFDDLGPLADPDLVGGASSVDRNC